MDIIKTEFLISEEEGINNLKPVYIFVHSTVFWNSGLKKYFQTSASIRDDSDKENI